MRSEEGTGACRTLWDRNRARPVGSESSAPCGRNSEMEIGTVRERLATITVPGSKQRDGDRDCKGALARPLLFPGRNSEMEIGTVRERLRDHYCSRVASGRLNVGNRKGDWSRARPADASGEAERRKSQGAAECRDYASFPGRDYASSPDQRPNVPLVSLVSFVPVTPRGSAPLWRAPQGLPHGQRPRCPLQFSPALPSCSR